MHQGKLRIRIYCVLGTLWLLLSGTGDFDNTLKIFYHLVKERDNYLDIT